MMYGAQHKLTHKMNNFNNTQLNTINVIQSNSNQGTTYPSNPLNSNYGSPVGNMSVGQSGGASSVTNRHTHKRNSNGGGMSGLGRNGMMTPTGFMTDPASANGGNNVIQYPQAH